jgi:pSer/pThr/pTyr-binding forkhead associated (FHA) protein
VITLNLLHPLQSIPIQSWTFEAESLIRIGRATDNDVILYSAVVSRYHVELRRQGSNWEVINLGANGTYLEGKRITEAPIKDGVMIRLARSGPQIQIHLGSSGTKDGQKTTSQKPVSGEAKPKEKSRDTLIYPKGEQQKEDSTELDY